MTSSILCLKCKNFLAKQIILKCSFPLYWGSKRPQQVMWDQAKCMWEMTQMKLKSKNLAETGRKATVSYPGSEPVVKKKKKRSEVMWPDEVQISRNKVEGESIWHKDSLSLWFLLYSTQNQNCWDNEVKCERSENGNTVDRKGLGRQEKVKDDSTWNSWTPFTMNPFTWKLHTPLKMKFTFFHYLLLFLPNSLLKDQLRCILLLSYLFLFLSHFILSKRNLLN